MFVFTGFFFFFYSVNRIGNNVYPSIDVKPTLNNVPCKHAKILLTVKQTRIEIYHDKIVSSL